MNEIGADGGTIREGGVELDIPPGALAEPVEIHVVDLGTAPPEGYEGLSTVWSFEPDGLVFAEPVTVRIPMQEHASPQVYWSEGDGYVLLPDATFADGFATASIEHFSTGFVSITPIETLETVYEPPQADVLFVVDNSCSMFDSQADLSNNAPTMFGTLTSSGLDYHIGVVSTDMNDPVNGQGQLRYVNQTSYIDDQTPDPQTVFSLMVNMGTTGFYDEKGRAAAYTMVELKRDIPRNEGFYRDDATLDIVFLSDEEDYSAAAPITRRDFLDWMAALKATPEMTRAHAITQLGPDLCDPAGSIGGEYLHYANGTDGHVADLCDSDWSSLFQGIVDDRLMTPAMVLLPVVPSQVVTVRFEGVSDLDLTPADYTLVGAEITFDQGVVPVVGDTIIVNYRP